MQSVRGLCVCSIVIHPDGGKNGTQYSVCPGRPEWEDESSVFTQVEKLSAEKQ